MSAKTKLNAFLAGLCLFGTLPRAQADAKAEAPSPTPITRPVDSYMRSRQHLIESYKPFLAELEGTRFNVYDDRGNAAVGWGYNFDINSPKKYALIQVAPKQVKGKVALKAKDMELLASDTLSFAEKQKKFPQYTLTEVSKTAAELKAASKPLGMDTSFAGSVYVMSAKKVNELNTVRLDEFIHEVENAVGLQRFYSWPEGARMAYLDMWYPARAKVLGYKFHKYMMAGNWELAATETWTSLQEKDHRRDITRAEWLLRLRVLPNDVEQTKAAYMKKLPGEYALHRAMGSFVENQAQENLEKLNALEKQKGSYGG